MFPLGLYCFGWTPYNYIFLGFCWFWFPQDSFHLAQIFLGLQSPLLRAMKELFLMPCKLRSCLCTGEWCQLSSEQHNIADAYLANIKISMEELLPSQPFPNLYMGSWSSSISVCFIGFDPVTFQIISSKCLPTEHIGEETLMSVNKIIILYSGTDQPP